MGTNSTNKLVWRKIVVRYTGRDGKKRETVDYEAYAMAGGKKIVLFNLSDAQNGSWLVTSPIVPTRIAGTYIRGEREARAAAEDALRAYGAWLVGISMNTEQQ